MRNTRNLGDLACCPADGFSEFDDCERRDWNDTRDLPEGTPIVLGGGGMFMPGFPDRLEQLNGFFRVAIWGAGMNYQLDAFPPSECGRLSKALSKCHGPVGVRNPGFAMHHGFEHVPCASAMSGVFTHFLKYQGEAHGIRAYEHADKRFAGSRYAAITNKGDSFQQAIQFISRATTIVTNSYHGAYWSCLLEKQVVLWRPYDWGNRFWDGPLEGWPEAKNFADVEKLRQVFTAGIHHISALHEARVDNQKFFGKVQKWLKTL